MVQDFNIEPDPRILVMLGEINLAQWKCAAELIDNAVDGFLHVIRSGGNPANPEIHVSIPLNDDPGARFMVTDNGPGMSPEVLEHAVKAGWSGNDPLAGLGMFGMGFNIATARLGLVTTVFTTQAGDPEWVGLKIDFEQLMRQRHFRTPRLTEPKHDPSLQGTKVVVEKLKPEQRQWFARSGNRTKLQNELSRVYSAMLRQSGVPMTVRITVAGRALEGRRHCVWGGPGNTPRVIQTARFGPVDAFQPIDQRLEPRLYCQVCWQWLRMGEDACPLCGRSETLIRRERAVKGWLGVQRYLSETDYGVDFLRHGRKIEYGNKDLFTWTDGDREEKEYPIDDPRGNGRIVGEIHLDHCRVAYTKDRFERTDPAWEDMVRIVRGEGPLRPEKARQIGFPLNDSPLSRLYQVFRRHLPKRKSGVGWGDLLVVPSNDTAKDLADKFHAGDPTCQTDDEWWNLIREADRQALLGPRGATPPGAPPPPGPGDTLDGLEPSAGAPPTTAAPAPGPVAAPPPPPRQTPLLSLTRLYMSDATGQKWDLKAFQVEGSHPELGGAPWRLKARPQGTHEFLVNTAHPVFASATLTPLDALLAELAWSAMDFLHDDPRDMTFGRALGDLRLKYASVTALDYVELSSEAKQALVAMASTLANNIEPSDAEVLFKDLPPDDQKAILQKMATRGAGNPQAIIGAGRFLEYASPRAVADFFSRHPELFLDGKCWDTEYATLDYALPAATEVARSQVVRHYESLLSDAIWLAEQDPTDLAQESRARLLRAMYALDLLVPNVEGAAE